MSNRRHLLLRLFGLLGLLMLPAALLGSNSASPALAEARLGAQTQSASSQASTDQLVMRVYFKDHAERDRLATELAAEEESTTNGYLTVINSRATYDDLVARGLRVEIDQRLTAKLADYLDPNSPNTFYGGYRTVEEIYAFLDAKVAAHPTLVQKLDIGDSWCKTHPGVCGEPSLPNPIPTWNGFDLYVLRISNQAITGPKPVFWYDAGIHSREIATPEIAMRFIDYLLNNYNTDADARWLVDYHDIHVMPVLNPDGHHMNETGGEGTPTLHRRNADKDDGCTTYDLYGTDINRNFPFVWGCCGGSSSNPCNDIYRGPAPNSEEETQAVVNKVRALIPDQRGPNESDVAPITTTGTLINMHSNAEQNLYPWGYTSAFAPNRTDLRNIGRHMSSPQVVPVGNGYEYCQNTECLYIVDGDEKNWAYGELGIPAYSLELSGDDFFPEYACLDSNGPPCTHDVGPGIWPQNKGALLHHAKIVRYPYLLTRGPDTNANTSTPIVVAQGSSATLTSTINYLWNGSDGQPNAYLQNVAAAEYYVDTPPWAGGTAVPMNAADGAYDEQTEPVTAGVPTGALSTGRHIVFMRGRGVNNYEGFQSWGPITAVFLDVIPVGSTSTPTTAPTGTTPPTNTAQPTNTTQPTNTAQPSVTATFGAPCGAIPIAPASTACQTAPDVYSYSFNFYVESGCTKPATGAATLSFYVSDSMTGTFTLFDTEQRTVTFPAGPGNVSFSGTITESNIPPSNAYYKIEFSAASVRPGSYQATSVTPLCPAGPTATPSVTPTACTLQFTDVPEGHTFYANIRCLACREIINGYSTGCETGNPCFRPQNNVTRGQLSKIVANSAAFNEPAGAQQFEDVPVGSTFFAFVWRLADRGIVTGYPCGGPGEPCGGGNLPYFRPNNNITRGQLSKIVAEAAGLTEPAGAQQFEDVVPGSTFYDYIWRLTSLGIMNGYPCGEPGEPCGGGNLPYFRPGANASRGQASKIVANTFFAGCETRR